MNDLTFTIGHEELVIRQRWEVVSIINDIFVAVWFALNILFGVGVSVIPGTSQEVAWQTHIGGFLAGLILFPLFDPVGASHHDAGDSEPGPTIH